MRSGYNRNIAAAAAGIIFILPILFAALGIAQSHPVNHGGLAEKNHPAKSGPPIRLNYLNVCTPAEADSQQISSALAKLPKKISLATDFEVSHGRTRLKNGSSSTYVRLRREMESGSAFASVQYSISNDGKNIAETLSFRARDPREVLEVSIEDQVAAETAQPGAVISTDTPAAHINVERFGKSSLALARCPEADQAAYQKIFDAASLVMERYRAELGLRTTFKSDFAWLKMTAAAPK